MDHEKKLAFIAKMTKMGLDHIQHMDAGGTIIPTNPTNPIDNPGMGPSINTASNTRPDVFGIINPYEPVSANLTPGTNTAQIGAAYTGAENAINAQTGLANQAMPGVSQGFETQSNLSKALADRAAGRGPNPAQAALAEATGKNTANTAAAIAGARGGSGNVGLMARQIGNIAGANQQGAVGQAATLEAQQEIAAQQEQGALAGAQIGIGAGAIQGLNNAQQNEQNILQNANTAANNAAVTQQSNINNANAQTAAGNQQAAQKTAGGILGGVASAIGGIFGLAKGGMVKMDAGGNVLDANARKHIAPHNFALPGGRYPIHDVAHARNALARVAQNGTAAEKAKVKAAVHKKYPELAGKKMADGGEINTEELSKALEESHPSKPKDTYEAAAQNIGQHVSSNTAGAANVMAAFGSKKPPPQQKAAGGSIAPTPLIVNNPSAPQSFVGQWLSSNTDTGGGASSGSLSPLSQDNSNPIGEGLSKLTGHERKGDVILPSGGDIELGGPGSGASIGAGAGMAGNDNFGLSVDSQAYGGLAAKGGNVKANSAKEKAEVKGDSLKNDKIPTLLSEGEVVLDRDTLQDPGPMGQMARALAKHIEKRNKGKK